jgi:phosphatidylglycerophosphatase A
MTEKTDPASAGAQGPSEAVTSPASAAKPQKKPRFALFVATAGGLGYFPKAPGTLGSLAGLVLSLLLLKLWPHTTIWEPSLHVGSFVASFGLAAVLFTLMIAALGVWASDRSARYLGAKDPQVIVIDEVSGQMIPLLFVAASTQGYIVEMSNFRDGFLWRGNANWKYLLLGFILFRVFDIWKPFPARQAESLPGGWGIMTDDWVAGIYAALGLWLARAAGL